MQSVLSVQDLTVSYGNMTALDGLTMDINAGEIVGLIGPNGAGKTSFIKVLCGRVDAARGTMHINGQALSRSQSRQHLIGLVPQDIGLYGHMTARENLIVFARLMQLSKRQGRIEVEQALEAVDLVHKADDRVDALSGGMKRRINVAAAIMHKPKLLILDEPTAGVDIPARDTIHRLARSLASQNMGVLLVTHELEQAEALCDRILLLAQGRKLAYDTPTDMLTQCYQGAREVMVRFGRPPDRSVMTSLQSFKFKEGDLPTIWTAMTDVNEVTFVSAFMTSMKGGDDLIREISVRRPGLPSLMHIVEKTGALPC
jgi:ABC-2 type transport system ATP-binding protein